LIRIINVCLQIQLQNVFTIKLKQEFKKNIKKKLKIPNWFYLRLFRIICINLLTIAAAKLPDSELKPKYCSRN